MFNSFSTQEQRTAGTELESLGKQLREAFDEQGCDPNRLVYVIGLGFMRVWRIDQSDDQEYWYVTDDAIVVHRKPLSPFGRVFNAHLADIGVSAIRIKRVARSFREYT